MGYSSTDYTRRPAAAVEADVSHYRSWYHVTDIFLDEASSDGGGAAYYQRLASYIHGVNPGSKVMLNPGTYPDQRYMSIGDIVMVYENTYASYVKLRVPGWVRNYPAAKFAHAIYATSSSELAGAISLSQQRQRRLYLRDRQFRCQPVQLTARLLAGRECDHRQMRPRRHVRRRPRPGRNRAGYIYRQGWRCPARADVNSVPSMPPEMSAGQKLTKVRGGVAAPVIGVLRVQNELPGPDVRRRHDPARLVIAAFLGEQEIGGGLERRRERRVVIPVLLSPRQAEVVGVGGKGAVIRLVLRLGDRETGAVGVRIVDIRLDRVESLGRALLPDHRLDNRHRGRRR